MKRFESTALVVGMAALWPTLVGAIAFLAQLARCRSAAR